MSHLLPVTVPDEPVQPVDGEATTRADGYREVCYVGDSGTRYLCVTDGAQRQWYLDRRARR